MTKPATFVRHSTMIVRTVIAHEFGFLCLESSPLERLCDRHAGGIANLPVIQFLVTSSHRFTRPGRVELSVDDPFLSGPSSCHQVAASRIGVLEPQEAANCVTYLAAVLAKARRHKTCAASRTLGAFAIFAGSAICCTRASWCLRPLARPTDARMGHGASRPFCFCTT